MLIGGRGLLDKLLVPSFHGHVPHIVPDVLRLKRLWHHSQRSNQRKKKAKRKSEIRLLCHARICECNTERFPWRRAFPLWFPAAAPLPSISSSSSFLLLPTLSLSSLHSLPFLIIGPHPSQKPTFSFLTQWAGLSHPLLLSPVRNILIKRLFLFTLLFN